MDYKEYIGVGVGKISKFEAHCRQGDEYLDNTECDEYLDNTESQALIELSVMQYWEFASARQTVSISSNIMWPPGSLKDIADARAQQLLSTMFARLLRTSSLQFERIKKERTSRPTAEDQRPQGKISMIERKKTVLGQNFEPPNSTVPHVVFPQC
ncbi:hypothetical protein CVT26_004749 [Gymnopilus dilepis]|uniref:Uncharacterized protein n=1 Tax=Gymnopilus dilepis TaxID=231916 RepID=A0A409XZI8_9AGAR|nr:hypothetical protein CVT26_004749 [Gymnopilus dilepis]